MLILVLVFILAVVLAVLILVVVLAFKALVLMLTIALIVAAFAVFAAQVAGLAMAARHVLAISARTGRRTTRLIALGVAAAGFTTFDVIWAFHGLEWGHLPLLGFVLLTGIAAGGAALLPDKVPVWVETPVNH